MMPTVIAECHVLVLLLNTCYNIDNLEFKNRG